jgi:hypothetical protein
MGKCDTPIFKQDENKVWQQFPCGKCLMCSKNRVSGWSFRLVKEGETADLSLFITLTYNTDNVPITRKGYMSLDIEKEVPNKHYEKQMRSWLKGKRKKEPKKNIQVGSDLTNFFKLLRKKTSRKIRYYAVGEYGDHTWRPHYHVILFNAEIQHVLDSWTKGEVHFGTVSEASIGYTLKYISKPKKVPQHQNDDRVREYSRMSKGLGANYLTDQMKQWHKNNLDERLYLPLLDGKKAPMPRYYKERIYTDQERGHLKGVMEKLAHQKEAEERKLYGDNYEKIKIDRIKNNKIKQNAKDKTGTI